MIQIPRLLCRHFRQKALASCAGKVSKDASIIISREGYGIRHSGWGGNPPRDPDDICNTSCKSSNECYNKYKVAKCSLNSSRMTAKYSSVSENTIQSMRRLKI